MLQRGFGHVAGARLHPVADGDRTFTVWAAAPHDDLAPLPNVRENVLQMASGTLNTRHFAHGTGGAAQG